MKRPPLASFKIREEVVPIVDPYNVRVRYDATASFTCTGHEAHLADMKEQAARMIAEEFYGEIREALLHVRKALYEENYRSSDDPVLMALQRAEELCRP